jgi:hypothetical protein
MQSEVTIWIITQIHFKCTDDFQVYNLQLGINTIGGKSSAEIAKGILY